MATVPHSSRLKRDRSPSPHTDPRNLGRKDKKHRRDKSAERKDRKAAKLRLRDEEDARQLADLSVYSATDNPFHDANLSQQFKWHKKAEKERKAGISPAEAQRKEAVRKQEAKEELERLNRRRAEREVEMRLRDEEEARMHRLAESAQMSEWIAKDDDFQLEQERRRAGIRLTEKRAKAVDFLALNLKYASPDFGRQADGDDGLGVDDAGLEIDLDEPYNIFDSLNADQVDELHDDIQRYLQLEKESLNIEFWTHMMVVCKDCLERLNSAKRGSDTTAAVEGEISVLLSGKSYEQLVLLQRQIQAKLASREPVDVDYWEGLLKSLLVWKAKSKLKSLHEVVVRNRLEQLRKRQRDEALIAQRELLAGTGSVALAKNWGGDMRVEPASAEGETGKLDAPDDVEQYSRDMSPPLVDLSKLRYEERQVDIVSEADDRRALFAQRRAVAGSRFVAKAVPKTIEVVPEAPEEEPIVFIDMGSDALYREEAENDMEEEEEAFNTEELLANPTTYSWEDKHRPRKPRYFNRVHTGYEWNKYNQTHYDTDNPPPKVVQGYKFNIFYPDLIDKTKAPTFKIVREPGNDETALLHFTAGPPYEDIGFRIVNREWEYSHKRGFRSSFDRGCLSLWFNFRRNFYRK